MSEGKDLLLLALSKQARGMPEADLHGTIAAFELLALDYPALRPYVAHSFIPSARVLYSHDVSLALSELLRDGYIELTKPLIGEHKIALTERGLERAKTLHRPARVDECLAESLTPQARHLGARQILRLARSNLDLYLLSSGGKPVSVAAAHREPVG